MARVAQRIAQMEGIKAIEVTGKQVRVVYDPSAVTLETITNAFYLQGVELIP